MSLSQLAGPRWKYRKNLPRLLSWRFQFDDIALEKRPKRLGSKESAERMLWRDS